MAAPFVGKTFKFVQPDGTELQVRGWGDQHYAVFETLDGYTLTENPATGFYEIAQVSTDGSMLESAPGPQGNVDGTRTGVPQGLRIDREAARARGREGVLRFGGRRCDERRERRKSIAQAARAFGGLETAPALRRTVGTFVGLCLLIDFVDEPATISRDEVVRFCNQPGYTGFGNNGSVSDYFREVSLGRCQYTNLVMDYYRARHPKPYYTDPSIEQGVRARQLIIEALTFWKNMNVDFTSLTVDGDGYVYAMNVFYAGEVTNRWREGLWPHAWHLATQIPLAPGKSAFDYQFTAMSQELTLGTFCHENGHMLCDYPDLYDYGNESSGVGGYCLMCTGGNINEKNPTHISAYLKRLSGWAGNLTTLEHNQTIELPAGQNEFAILSKNATEYFLIENRQKGARDAALTSEGLAIWHVDEEGNNSNEQMTPALHYELTLKQADGKNHLERTRWHFGDSEDLYGRTSRRFANDTSPSSKWWDGTASNLELFNITAPAATVRFSAKLLGGGAGSAAIHRQSTPALSIPDNTPSGVNDTIWIDQDAIIAGAQVELDITHPYRGDLEVDLRTPWGTMIRLHQRSQGGDADHLQRVYVEADIPGLGTFRGRSAKGNWQLFVRDSAPGDVGKLNRWGLRLTVAHQSQGQIVLRDLAGVLIPDNNPAGVLRILTATSSQKVANIEVSIDITHTHIGDLRVSLRSPVGTEVLLHNLTGGSTDNLVTTYTPMTTPDLSALTGQAIGGQWRLAVADRAGQSVGKINSWRLVIEPN